MKTQMQNRNPFLPFIFIIIFIIGSLCIAFVAYIINITRGPVEPPKWLSLARIVIYLFAGYSILSSFLMKRHIRRESIDKIVKQVKDPSLSFFVIGLVRFLSIPCLAFFGFYLGGPPTDIYICSVLSIIGIVFWSWYQRAVFKID